jgi:hypothetical protein
MIATSQTLENEVWLNMQGYFLRVSYTGTKIECLWRKENKYIHKERLKEYILQKEEKRHRKRQEKRERQEWSKHTELTSYECADLHPLKTCDGLPSTQGLMYTVSVTTQHEPVSHGECFSKDRQRYSEASWANFNSMFLWKVPNFN